MKNTKGFIEIYHIGMLSVLLLFGWMIYLIYVDYTSPVIELKKDNWECIKTKEEAIECTKAMLNAALNFEV